MGKLDFSNQWIQWTTTLYEEVEILVAMNGQKGKSFQMERAIRQRCPITLYLYLFVVDVLGYMISNPRYKIERLTLFGYPNLRPNVVDDTMMFLKVDPNNLQKTFQVLQTFCEASRGKVNWHKSSAIWAFKKNRKWSWGEDKRLFW